jgi:hypothetical protein
VPALVREWQAAENPDKRAILFRQAGDRYVAEGSDWESALRCYSGALNAGTEADLAISPDDNWLLMALKDARQKEKRHANVGN